jgi:hypothetical protein
LSRYAVDITEILVESKVCAASVNREAIRNASAQIRRVNIWVGGFVIGAPRFSPSLPERA